MSDTLFQPKAVTVTYNGSLTDSHGVGWLHSFNEDTGRYVIFIPGTGLLRNVRSQSFTYGSKS